MPTVLLGWELGAGFGHVAGLLQIANALARRGLTPVLALRDLEGPSPLLRDCPFSVLQAPRLIPAGDPSFFATSFGDVLAASGFANATGLASALRGWDAVLDTVRPSVVVTNHAPTLALAAFGAVPTVGTGTGFTVPPGDGATFPALIGGAPHVVAQGMDEVVRSVLAERARPAPNALTELYREDCYPLTVKELDPYAPVRTRPVPGPLRPMPHVLAPPSQPRFFAYLSADAGWPEEALLSMGRVAEGEVYLRGAEPGTAKRLEDGGLRVWPEAPPLSDVLARASLVVHHGSHATAQATLAAGRPQLCLPRHLEQSLTGHLLEQQGVARCLRGELPVEAPLEALRTLLSDPARAQAAAVAEGIAARHELPCLDAVADRCAELASG